MKNIRYQLPDGRVFNCDYDLCRGESRITYELDRDPVTDRRRIVEAKIVPGQDVEAAYRAWRDR